jgi:hypothetical protein
MTLNIHCFLESFTQSPKDNPGQSNNHVVTIALDPKEHAGKIQKKSNRSRNQLV